MLRKDTHAYSSCPSSFAHAVAGWPGGRVAEWLRGGCVRACSTEIGCVSQPKIFTVSKKLNIFAQKGAAWTRTRTRKEQQVRSPAGCETKERERAAAAAEFEFEIQKAHTPSTLGANERAVRQCPCPAAGHWRKMR